MLISIDSLVISNTKVLLSVLSLAFFSLISHNSTIFVFCFVSAYYFLYGFLTVLLELLLSLLRQIMLTAVMQSSAILHH